MDMKWADRSDEFKGEQERRILDQVADILGVESGGCAGECVSPMEQNTPPVQQSTRPVQQSTPIVEQHAIQRTVLFNNARVMSSSYDMKTTSPTDTDMRNITLGEPVWYNVHGLLSPPGMTETSGISYQIIEGLDTQSTNRRDVPFTDPPADGETLIYVDWGFGPVPVCVTENSDDIPSLANYHAAREEMLNASPSFKSKPSVVIGDTPNISLTPVVEAIERSILSARASPSGSRNPINETIMRAMDAARAATKSQASFLWESSRNRNEMRAWVEIEVETFLDKLKSKLTTYMYSCDASQVSNASNAIRSLVEKTDGVVEKSLALRLSNNDLGRLLGSRT